VGRRIRVCHLKPNPNNLWLAESGKAAPFTVIMMHRNDSTEKNNQLNSHEYKKRHLTNWGDTIIFPLDDSTKLPTNKETRERL
jgi:hypothetical protein